MPAIHTTRRLLSAYADKEPWKQAHDKTQMCLDVEEKLAWGVHLFRGLVDLEARQQAHAMQRPDADAVQFLEVMPLLYQVWLDASEFFLDAARGFANCGYVVDGLEPFEATVEEARCLLENLALEDEIRVAEELISIARPENPRPDRYGE